MPTLPHVDEHATAVTASPADTWTALRDSLDRGLSRRRNEHVARLLGCADRRTGGPRPLDVGSTVPGFRVTAAAPGELLELTGRHRFAAYTLTFRLDAEPGGGSRLRAETRADFPGPAGRAYRALVIGSGGHVVAVRRMLAGAARQAERRGGGREGRG